MTLEFIHYAILGGFGASVLWAFGDDVLDGCRRLFRRTPPHLRGRVPVECGEGTLTCGPGLSKTDLSFAKHYGTSNEVARQNFSAEEMRKALAPKWTPPPDDVGRAFLRSVAALEMPTKSKPWDPDTPVSKEEWWAHARRVEAEMMGRKPPADALEAMPTPAENARRYTQEDGTW